MPTLWPVYRLPWGCQTFGLRLTQSEGLTWRMVGSEAALAVCMALRSSKFSSIFSATWACRWDVSVAFPCPVPDQDPTHVQTPC